jgi:glycosyltransferase involved in cell wall biosynthesis
LHVIPSVSLSDGGPSYAVFAFARAAQLAGAETVIVTTGHDEPAQDNGIKCVRFDRNFEPYKISFSLRHWLDRHVREFDLVHIHALFSFSSRAAARAAQKKGVPYVIRPLGVLNRWGLTNRRRLLKRFWLQFSELPILKNAAAIHYTSQAEREEAGMIGEGIAQLPSFIVPIPVKQPVAGSWEHGVKNSFSDRFPSAIGKKVVLFLARLDEKKGLDLLLRAFAELKREHADSALVIAGTGRPEFVDALHDQANSLGIADDIIWTGFLNGADKASAFSAATVFVLPSYSENFGIAAAEALAAGVPTLLSDQVAIARDAENADAAVVVCPEAAAFAAAMKQLLGNPSRREELARNAKLFARHAFSSERVSELLVSEYHKILNQTASK